jgi:hypothetical protein
MRHEFVLATNGDSMTALLILIAALLGFILAELRSIHNDVRTSLFDIRYLLADEDPGKHGGRSYVKFKGIR